MSAYVGMFAGMYVGVCRHSGYMSAWSVYVGMYACVCRHMSAYVGFVGLSAYVGLVGIYRLWSAHMSAYVGFGRHMSDFWSVYVGMSVSGVGGAL